MNLRPTQQAILEYTQTGGRMAVAAVPGSGKTFTLTLLAAQLIADGQIENSQQVLIVTYLNTSVDNFKSRIRERLTDLGLNPDVGYDVRTLHSLGLEIVRFVNGGEAGNELIVLDEAQADRFLNLAIDNWRDGYPQAWNSFLPGEGAGPQAQARWRRTVEKTAKAFIRTAKNERYRPDVVLSKLEALEKKLAEEPDEELEERFSRPFLRMLAGVYANYQAIVTRQGALDFNDLIGQAADLMANRPDLAAVLRQRWPYVLEDEAQDSVPLQETLLGALTGDRGNWVRVGDPNQAITSTFTAAHPRFLTDFMQLPDVVAQPLPHSGRCAPKILAAANELVRWTSEQHGVAEVRANAFLPQEMLPTPAGDGQPNPPDSESRIVVKVYSHREDEEIPDVARLAHLYTQRRPEQTVAILVPTNDLGHKISERLDQLEASYDNLLRGGTREREIASVIHAMIALLGDPLKGKHLRDAYMALVEIGHPAADVPEAQLDRFEPMLRSVVQAEKLLYPAPNSQDWEEALPRGVVKREDFEYIGRFVQFLQRIFPLRLLPIDDLVIALSDELFAYDDSDINETDLAIAYQIANLLRGWYDMNPTWRLPELATELADIANGRRHLSVVRPEEGGYEPQPARITLTTQHGSKGLEWDGVFLVGIDGMWVPGDLDAYFLGVDDQLGGDPTAELTAQLKAVMTGGDGTYPGRTPTESAHIEVICERLRLFYVGITRAKRFLQISRSRKTRTYRQERDSVPATALGTMYRYVKSIGDA